MSRLQMFAWYWRELYDQVLGLTKQTRFYAFKSYLESVVKVDLIRYLNCFLFMISEIVRNNEFVYDYD